jgi:hypothetical protein
MVFSPKGFYNYLVRAMIDLMFEIKKLNDFIAKLMEASKRDLPCG